MTGSRTRVDENTEATVTTSTGPWAAVPIWILDPSLYLPGADPSTLRAGDDKPLNAAEIRVYIALRSFADRYTGKAHPFVKTIAARACVHGKTAEKAIAKFRRLGWVSTRRKYRADGSIHSCDYHLIDQCPQPRQGGFPRTGGEGVPADSREGYPSNDGEGTREVAGAKNTPDEHTKRTHQRTELNWRTADAARAQTNEPTPTPVNQPAGSRTGYTDWSDDDYDLFSALVPGEHITSDGSVWTEGAYPLRSWYNAFRQRSRNPVRWPGKYFDQMNDNGGFESYLASQGLEIQ